MGEVRFDQYIADKMEMQNSSYRNMEIERKYYVLIRDTTCHSNTKETDGWFRFPTKGQLIWWCGPNGNQISVVDDTP